MQVRNLARRPLRIARRIRDARSSQSEYWERRARELGERAVFNAGHSAEDLPAVTAMQKDALYPLLRRSLDGSERTVLDFGCGTGRFTVDLAEIVGGMAIGVDPTPGLLELAPRSEAVEYRRMSPGEIPLPDGWADVIWVCIVLGGITDDDALRKTAGELQRVLRPGGLLFLVENTAEKPPLAHWVFRSATDYANVFSSVRLTPIGEYEDMGELVSVLAGRTRRPRAEGTVRSCLVTGSGRSGTSMLAGMLAQSGYYMGSQPLQVNFAPPPERQTNPKGNFEDVEINAINEEIIAPLYPRSRRTRIGRAIQARRVLTPGLRWAADLPPDIEVSADADLAARMREQTAHEPFCFKDPRFALTLPAWRPHLGDAAFVCVFRHPARTVNSILAEWSRHRRSYEMTPARALAAWRCSYLQILTRHCHDGDWLFLHYDQILGGSAVPRIETFLGAMVDRSFPDPALKRSSGAGEIGAVERDIYLELCNRAGYRDRDTALNRRS